MLNNNNYMTTWFTTAHYHHNDNYIISILNNVVYLRGGKELSKPYRFHIYKRSNFIHR